MTVRLVEFEPGRWRVDKPRTSGPRSNLPMPHVISDIMPPTEQVDGKFYTSKRQFRAVGRALGLTEVGNEKPKPRKPWGFDRASKEKRMQSVKIAVEKVKAGYRS